MHRSNLFAQLRVGTLYAGLIYGAALVMAACSDGTTAPKKPVSTAVSGIRKMEAADCDDDECDDDNGGDGSVMGATMLQSIDYAVDDRTLNTPECQQLVDYWYSVPAANIRYNPSEPGWAYTDPPPGNPNGKWDPDNVTIGFTKRTVGGPWAKASSAIHEAAHGFFGGSLGDGPAYVNGQWNQNSAYGWQAHCTPGP